MNFSHNYFKLANKIFTTIRRRPKHKKGDIIPIRINKRTVFRAKVLDVGEAYLTEVPRQFLIFDCLYSNSEIKSKEDCLNLIRSFYYNEIDFSEETFIIYLLLRVDPLITEFTELNKNKNEVKNKNERE